MAVLSAMAALGCLVGLLVYRVKRPTEYRPDEPSADITSSLARDLPPDAPMPNFTDATKDAGLGDFRTFAGNRTSQLPEDVGSGAAWGDFDNDGDDDLFLVSAGGALTLASDALAPSELYENLGNGRFRKVEKFPATRIHGMGAAWGDYDGDGFLDLVVTGYQALLLFHNDGGTGQFSPDTRLPIRSGFWAGASWGDYNNDRWPDLYVCEYVRFDSTEADRERASLQVGATVPFTLNPASYAGGTNLLFHNNGDGTFRERGAELKVQNPEGRSLAALWYDFDDDGWLDLYVANDISDNVFYRNAQGTFEDISHPALVADYRSAMGLAVGDYNRDGDDDLFVTHWVAQENALYDNLLADLRRSDTAPPRGRPGLHAAPPPDSVRAPLATPVRFLDVADSRGLGQMALPYVGWGTEFVDLDGDGWLDLVVANGNTLEFSGPIPRKLKPQEPFLLWNRRGEHFYNLVPLSKPLGEPHNGRGLAVADYDEDGDMDVLLMHLGEGAQLLRNQMQTNHWIKVRLRSCNGHGQPLGFGDGAKVTVFAGGTQQRRGVSSASYLSQSSRTLHFGLGSATSIERLQVCWHAGETNTFDDLDVNAKYEITEGEVEAVVVGRAQPPSVTDRDRWRRFWETQRAAMNAMKVEKNNAKAITLFRAALALNPAHEDSLYYLGLCLASEGKTEPALAQLRELQRINPQSHRAWQQWGVLRASSSRELADLESAQGALERAHAINPEETGALLVLGEIALLRGNAAEAAERLSAACQTNPKAVGGFFLSAYIAWHNGDDAAARRLLEGARVALGPDWQPRGATSEGDVQRRQHVEITPLARFWQDWDGTTSPAQSLTALHTYLTKR